MFNFLFRRFCGDGSVGSPERTSASDEAVLLVRGVSLVAPNILRRCPSTRAVRSNTHGPPYYVLNGVGDGIIGWQGTIERFTTIFPTLSLVNRPWCRLLSPLDDGDELRLREPLVGEIRDIVPLLEPSILFL